MKLWSIYPGFFLIVFVTMSHESDVVEIFDNHLSEELDETGLESLSAAVQNWTAIQLASIEQEKLFHQENKARRLEEEERELARIKTLQEEQNSLRNLKGKVNRKLRGLSKETHPKSMRLGKNQNSCSTSVLPKDCAEIYLDGEETSGIYTVQPTWESNKGFLVFCDMDTDGGGWTVIQRRGSFGVDTEYFQKSWKEYRTGFGDLRTEFWLGNENIYALTRQGGYQLRFDLQDAYDKQFAVYNAFWIEGEARHYRLHLGNYNTDGNMSDVFRAHDNATFSTMDMSTITQREPYNPYGRLPQQKKDGTDCAKETRRGWWFSDSQCHLAHELNLQPGNRLSTWNMKYDVSEISWSGEIPSEALLVSELKIRPVRFLKSKQE